MTKYSVEAIFILYSWYICFKLVVEILNFIIKANPYWEEIEDFENQIFDSTLDVNMLSDEQKSNLESCEKYTRLFLLAIDQAIYVSSSRYKTKF